MRKKFMLASVSVLLGFTLVAAGCSSDSDSSSGSDETTTTVEKTTTTEAAATDSETIVDIASGDPQFSTLVTAVTEAGLAETLSGDGPFTVFAPTNAAFDALPAGTLDTLLADPTGDLADILKLHVIAGEVDAAAATAAVGTCVETLGGKVLIGQEGDNLTIGGATITSTDIKASNGIIHVIDGVITAASTDCPA